MYERSLDCTVTTSDCVWIEEATTEPAKPEKLLQNNT
jgi:hypothetical protein